MRVLALDTSTELCDLALVEDGRLVAALAFTAPAAHSHRLLPACRSMLEEAGWSLAAVDLLAVGLGPGSFTGLRVGLATVKGLALASSLPVVGVPSLEATAYTAWPMALSICPVLDARKGDVYARLYASRDCGVEPLTAPLTAPLGAVLEGVKQETLFLADGAGKYREPIAARLGGLARFPAPSGPLQKAGAVALLGAARFEQRGPDDIVGLLPEYWRRPEAEVNYERRLAESEGGGR